MRIADDCNLTGDDNRRLRSSRCLQNKDAAVAAAILHQPGLTVDDYERFKRLLAFVWMRLQRLVTCCFKVPAKMMMMIMMLSMMLMIMIMIISAKWLSEVNGGDTAFVWCVRLSVRSGLVSQTILKRLKLRTSSLTCMFPRTVRSWPLKNFRKRGPGQDHVTPKFLGIKCNYNYFSTNHDNFTKFGNKAFV